MNLMSQTILKLRWGKIITSRACIFVSEFLSAHGCPQLPQVRPQRSSTYWVALKSDLAVEVMCHRLYFKPTTSQILCRLRYLDFIQWTPTTSKPHLNLSIHVALVIRGWAAFKQCYLYGWWLWGRRPQFIASCQRLRDEWAVYQRLVRHLRFQLKTCFQSQEILWNLEAEYLGCRITMEAEKVSEREGKERITLDVVNG